MRKGWINMGKSVKSEDKSINKQQKKNEIKIFNIPEEYENDFEIVNFERKTDLRITERKGFDIITNSFFVDKELVYKDADGEERRRTISSSFNDFDSYFTFLNGDIYDNACYTFCHLSDEIIVSRNIDLEKMMEREAFVENSIDDYSLSVSSEEIENYKESEQVHKHCQRWISKFNSCNSYEELVKTVSNYKKSKIVSIVDVSFFFFHYFFANIEDKKRFSIIMEYMSSGAYPEYKLINPLCSIYDPDDVMQSFNYSLGAKSTINKKKRMLKNYIRLLKAGEIEFYTHAYFDNKTHYYCEETCGYKKEHKSFPISTIYRYFETFEDFINYRNGDLTNCDLSSALELDVDLSKYIIDKTTKLPIHVTMETIYSVKKYYHNEKFYVLQQWCNISGSVIKEYKHSFNYFFDFVAFLKNDLSGADLLFCDGLAFLEQWDSINFKDAKMNSVLCEKFGVKFEAYKIKTYLIESFECIEQNETETALVLEDSRDLTAEIRKRDLSFFDVAFGYKCQKVHYISDIHLMHRIQNAKCHSKEDVLYVIQKIVDSIVHEVSNLLLIDGDVASDFEIFQLFVKMLSQTLHHRKTVVFTLGNHELWSFPDLSIDKIVSKYRTLLDEHGMYLLQNDILYKEASSPFSDGNTGLHLIKYEELCAIDDTQIVERLRSARYVILGGLGFSGYNTEFNADNGIYRKTLDRATEIKESQKFEALYNRLHPILNNKNTIILTHTPKKDWCRDSEYQKNYIYVSGHTHRNFFYDDGEYRVYSDNQIGYQNDSPHLKSFLIDNDYDCFADYADGIYEITNEQYNDFYRGKNIAMNFQREINVLYMLKKNGYYCFIHEAQSGNLTILNGGAMKKLESTSVQYYYDNMDAMIATIKTPFDQFTVFQKRIANKIKKIGGDGTIHGCIIDIDFYNHIYVNPIDLTMVGYWASDIINKIVYPSIPALLEKRCPRIFDQYVKLLEGKSGNPFALKKQTGIVSSPQKYFDTDIYRASREIKKMQKLSSNILSSWYENALYKNPRIKLT